MLQDFRPSTPRTQKKQQIASWPTKLCWTSLRFHRWEDPSIPNPKQPLDSWCDRLRRIHSGANSNNYILHLWKHSLFQSIDFVDVFCWVRNPKTMLPNTKNMRTFVNCLTCGAYRGPTVSSVESKQQTSHPITIFDSLGIDMKPISSMPLWFFRFHQNQKSPENTRQGITGNHSFFNHLRLGSLLRVESKRILGGNKSLNNAGFRWALGLA